MKISQASLAIYRNYIVQACVCSIYIVTAAKRRHRVLWYHASVTTSITDSALEYESRIILSSGLSLDASVSKTTGSAHCSCCKPPLTLDITRASTSLSGSAQSTEISVWFQSKYFPVMNFLRATAASRSPNPPSCLPPDHRGSSPNLPFCLPPDHRGSSPNPPSCLPPDHRGSSPNPLSCLPPDHRGSSPIPPSCLPPDHRGSSPNPPSCLPLDHRGSSPNPPSCLPPDHRGSSPNPPSCLPPDHRGSSPNPPSCLPPDHRGSSPNPPSCLPPDHRGSSPNPPSCLPLDHRGSSPNPPSCLPPDHRGSSPNPPSCLPPDHRSSSPKPPSCLPPDHRGSSPNPPSCLPPDHRGSSPNPPSCLPLDHRGSSPNPPSCLPPDHRGSSPNPPSCLPPDHRGSSPKPPSCLPPANRGSSPKPPSCLPLANRGSSPNPPSRTQIGLYLSTSGDLLVRPPRSRAHHNLLLSSGGDDTLFDCPRLSIYTTKNRFQLDRRAQPIMSSVDLKRCEQEMQSHYYPKLHMCRDQRRSNLYFARTHLTQLEGCLTNRRMEQFFHVEVIIKGQYLSGCLEARSGGFYSGYQAGLKSARDRPTHQSEVDSGMSRTTDEQVQCPVHEEQTDTVQTVVQAGSRLCVSCLGSPGGDIYEENGGVPEPVPKDHCERLRNIREIQQLTSTSTINIVISLNTSLHDPVGSVCDLYSSRPPKEPVYSYLILRLWLAQHPPPTNLHYPETKTGLNLVHLARSPVLRPVSDLIIIIDNLTLCWFQRNPSTVALAAVTPAAMCRSIAKGTRTGEMHLLGVDAKHRWKLESGYKLVCARTMLLSRWILGLRVVEEAASPVLLGPWHHQHRVFTRECELPTSGVSPTRSLGTPTPCVHKGVRATHQWGESYSVLGTTNTVMFTRECELPTSGVSPTRSLAPPTPCVHKGVRAYPPVGSKEEQAVNLNSSGGALFVKRMDRDRYDGGSEKSSSRKRNSPSRTKRNIRSAAYYGVRMATSNVELQSGNDSEFKGEEWKHEQEGGILDHPEVHGEVELGALCTIRINEQHPESTLSSSDWAYNSLSIDLYVKNTGWRYDFLLEESAKLFMDTLLPDDEMNDNNDHKTDRSTSGLYSGLRSQRMGAAVEEGKNDEDNQENSEEHSSEALWCV
uniref:Uncharacterized protein n=1 Tax=Timema shepardi TaxID=629360 RepID=A0A7R9G374_TIMSH|nr:unnamed protein product [Timema shepardi]